MLITESTISLKVTHCILWAVHCLCRMCRCVLLVVLWLLIGTRSCLLILGLLSIAEPLCPSWCRFGMILVTLCLMMWDLWISRAEPMLSSWHDLFLFWLLLFYVFLPSMGWLCGVWVFGLIVLSLSPRLAPRTPNVNNNNDKGHLALPQHGKWVI